MSDEHVVPLLGAPVLDPELVLKVMELVTSRAKDLPVFSYVIRPVMVSVVDLEDFYLGSPVATLAVSDGVPVVEARFPGTLEAGKVAPVCGVMGVFASQSAESAVSLPACGAMVKRGGAPFAGLGDARLLEFTGTEGEMRLARMRAVPDLAVLVSDDEALGASGADSGPLLDIDLRCAEALEGAESMGFSSLKDDGARFAGVGGRHG